MRRRRRWTSRWWWWGGGGGGGVGGGGRKQQPARRPGWRLRPRSGLEQSQRPGLELRPATSTAPTPTTPPPPPPCQVGRWQCHDISGLPPLGNQILYERLRLKTSHIQTCQNCQHRRHCCLLFTSWCNGSNLLVLLFCSTTAPSFILLCNIFPPSFVGPTKIKKQLDNTLATAWSQFKESLTVWGQPSKC